MNRPDREPCGCRWGSADFPWDPKTEETVTTAIIECYECGATWDAKEDDGWVTSWDRK